MAIKFANVRVRIMSSLVNMAGSLALAGLLGGIVGYEREIHERPAGLRTHILVCLGSIIGPLTFENGGKEMSYCGKDEGDIGTGLYVWDLKRRASSRWGSLDTPGSGSVASWNLMLATRPDGTRERFTLSAHPSAISVNQKEMYEVTVRRSP